jgi:two-component system cell cycle response regulator PopA
MTTPAKVLFVECDAPEDAGFISRFAKLGAIGIAASSLDAALQIAQHENFDALVVRERAGPALLTPRIRSFAATAQIPVISIVAAPGLGLQASPAGSNGEAADANLTRLFDERELVVRVQSLSRLATMRGELRRRLESIQRFGGVGKIEMPESLSPISDARVLIVSSSPEESQEISDALSNQTTVAVARSEAETIERLEQFDADCVIIAAVWSPDAVVDLCQRLRTDSRRFHLPVEVVAVSGSFEAGSRLGRHNVEIIDPPWSAALLRARVDGAVRQHRFRRAMLGVFSAARPSGAVDGLTGLFNAEFLLRHLDSQIAEAHLQRRNLTVGILAIAAMNLLQQQFGETMASALLRQVGLVIGRLVRAEDLAARTAGGEFVLVFSDTTVEAASNAARRLADVVECTEFGVGGGEEPVRVGFHLGLAAMEPGDTAVSLLDRVREKSKAT